MVKFMMIARYSLVLLYTANHGNAVPFVYLSWPRERLDVKVQGPKAYVGK